MLIYYLGISLYSVAIFLAQLFNAKAKKLYLGRKKTWGILQTFKRDHSKQLAWFHCASLGEFEQARPVIERLKQERDIQIAVSFFSPSGYEIRKDYALADVVFYLPSDTTANAQKLLKALSPDLVFFVKYEIWVNLINQIFKHQIPLYLLSATFRKEHIYFKWYGKLFNKALKAFTRIFTQDESSTQLLKQKGFVNVVKSNDTRYDRVYDTCLKVKPLPIIEAFVQQQQVLILGSSYEEEEKMAWEFIKQLKDVQVKLIIAPHQVTATRIAQIEQLFNSFHPIKYSQATNNHMVESNVLIIDNVGLLASIYAYAHIAIIGGGFGKKGIHNTLEAATFGMPIFIGPNNHQKFPELALLKDAGVLHTIVNQQLFIEQLNDFIWHQPKLSAVKQQSRTLIQQNIGATQVILSHLPA